MGSRDTTGWLSIVLPAVLAAGSVQAGDCAADRLDLRGPGGAARFTVEVADTGAERAQGLMFRKKMATTAGMLFVYDSPRSVSFWMKNTLIPLDMVFADARGVVRHVHQGAVPGDLTPLPGGNGVQYVLEINAGLAGKLGIGPGTELRHPLIGAGAAWPCP